MQMGTASMQMMVTAMTGILLSIRALTSSHTIRSTRTATARTSPMWMEMVCPAGLEARTVTIRIQDDTRDSMKSLMMALTRIVTERT
jgi:hypothetical protein